MGKHLLHKLVLSCRLSALLLMCMILVAPATAQNKTVDLSATVTMSLDNSTVQSALNTLSKRSGIKIVYTIEDVQSLPRVSGQFNNASIQSILDKCLANTKLRYKVADNAIIVELITNVERITIHGTVTDYKKIPLPGATIALKGTNVGVSADEFGRYKISFARTANMVLQYSFIGSESYELAITKSTELNIRLKDSETHIEDVVVNGMFTRNRNTFTGSTTTLKGEDIVAMSSTNLIGTIAALTPGMSLVTNNAAGSNPNVMPNILIRGANSIVTKDEQQAYNNPLIILDGVEITMEELYDLDIFEIERVDVLKDAQAAIVYGERAANGVIVIERYRVTDSKVKISYNFVPDFSIADLSSMNLCNAEQKLELERLAEVYQSPNGKYDRAYLSKLENVRRGVNTNWIEAPIRTTFSHTHSLQLSGRGQNVDYRASVKFSDKYGVMKGDNRRNYQFNFGIGYHVQDKLTISYTASYSLTDSNGSPYGSFSDYTKMNPYNPVFDEYGNYIKQYPFYGNDFPTDYLDDNPLYNATLSSFSKTSNQFLRNSVNAKWYLTKLFFVTGQFNLSMNKNQYDNFTSPLHSKFLTAKTAADRGEYILRTGNGLDYDGKLLINYSKSLDTKGSGFAINAGADFGRNNSNNASVAAKGFLKDKLNDIKYATAYNDNNKPSGEEKLSSRVGFIGSANIYFRNRYFADISYTTKGSSTYGKNDRFAPIWATGIGWNLHKEKFMENVKWLNILRFKASIGYTGSVGYNPYMAMNKYKYTDKNDYYTGIGANPITMGNSNLKWQRTLKTNYGVTMTLLNERVNLGFDYYVNNTTDMLMNVTVPSSVGVKSVMINFGEMANRGYDISISAQVIKGKDFSWITSINTAHVSDRINKVSDAFKNESFKVNGLNVRIMEGRSQYDIYTARSAGIDPATGQEIFIKSDGTYTYIYPSSDLAVVGNTNPTLYGTWSNTLRYKGLSLNFAFQYTFGADMYNQTIAKKVENIDPRTNVDARAFTDRWKKPGDLTRFQSLIKSSSDYSSERFIERHNELYLSNVSLNYDFAPKVLEKIGIKRLLIGIGMSDVVRFSTVKYERGTEYPFMRSFNLTFRPTF